jgi:2-polyprenyl-6-methoxyphenol hydroxylase-like FAD-dependent oxidoreductase
MNFVFAGNGFFGYFFADSDSSASNRDSLYHVSEPGMSLSWWSTYAIEECPDPKTLDMEDVANELRKRHANWKDPVIQKIIQSARVENMYPTWTSPPLPTWERDGVVLVGDAAHALPPTSGQGSSQALEDVEAFVLFLAHHLQKAEQHQLATEVMTQKQTIKIAAKQYMDIRKPRVTEILEAAQKIQNSKRDKGVIAEFMMYSMMSIIGELHASC